MRAQAARASDRGNALLSTKREAQTRTVVGRHNDLRRRQSASARERQTEEASRPMPRAFNGQTVWA